MCQSCSRMEASCQARLHIIDLASAHAYMYGHIYGTSEFTPVVR